MPLNSAHLHQAIETLRGAARSAGAKLRPHAEAAASKIKHAGHEAMRRGGEAWEHAKPELKRMGNEALVKGRKAYRHARSEGPKVPGRLKSRLNAHIDSVDPEVIARKARNKKIAHGVGAAAVATGGGMLLRKAIRHRRERK